MAAPHPGVVGDAWDGNEGEGGQSEEDVGDGGQSEPELDGGVAPLPSLHLLLWLLSRLSLQLPSLKSYHPCLQQADEAEG